MFPWSPEFAWDATHVVFFGALYSVLATVAGQPGPRRLARPARRPRRAERPRSPGTATSRRCPPRPAPAATSSPARPRAGRARTASTAGAAPSTRDFEALRQASDAPRRRGRPLRLRPAARPPLPPRAHLGAAGGRRHPHGRPRRPRPPPRRDAGAGGAARGRQPAPGERPRGPAHHPRPRRAGALPRGRHRRRGARRGRRLRRCASTPAVRRTSGTCSPGPKPVSGRCGSWSGCSGPSARASWARPSPTAASWSRTWARPCPATATTRSSATCCWSRSHGLPEECAVNLDHVQTVARARLGALVTTLPGRRMDEIREALLFALGG